MNVVDIIQRLKAMGHSVDARKIILTPDLARELLTHMAHNRPFRPSRVEYYASTISKNEWKYTGQGLIFSTDGTMINGQHTCLAVIKADRPIEVFVVLDVPPEAWLYMDQASARTSADMISHAFSEEVQHPKVVAAALAFIHSEQMGLRSRRGLLMPPQAPDLLKQFPDVTVAAAWANDHTGPGKIRMTSGMLAYCLFRARVHNPEKADVFVARLFDGLQLTATSPAYLLRERLNSNAASRSKLQPPDVLALWIKAWTFFDDDRTLAILKWNGGRDKKRVRAEKFPTWPGPVLPGTVIKTSAEESEEASELPLYAVMAKQVQATLVP